MATVEFERSESGGEGRGGCTATAAAATAAASGGKRRACLICGAPTTYAHFGIDSCRACAEFYKRTLTSNKNYACRQGSRACVISKNERFVCRRCRFEKCRALGMSLDDPRKRRPKPVEKHEQLSPERGAEEEGEEAGPSSSSSGSLPSVIVENRSAEHLLDRIANEHSVSMARRRASELRVRPTSLRSHVSVGSPCDDILLCTWTFLMDCLRVYAGDYLEMASGCFPEFAALSLERKLVMLRNCALRIYILESHVLTQRTFGRQDTPLCMITLTTCLDLDNIKFLIEEENPSTRHGEIIRSMSYYVSRIERLVRPILAKTELTDIEFSAIFGLAVWQFDPCSTVDDDLVATADKVRNEIYADLRRYYREELRLADYSVRLGNLMSLEHTIQEASALMAEELQTYNLLNMLQADTSFLQVVLQISL